MGARRLGISRQKAEGLLLGQRARTIHLLRLLGQCDCVRCERGWQAGQRRGEQTDAAGVGRRVSNCGGRLESAS